MTMGRNNCGYIMGGYDDYIIKGLLKAHITACHLINGSVSSVLKMISSLYCSALN